MSYEVGTDVRSKAFVVYVRSIGDMLSHLPGMSQFPVQDRINIYLNAFFPVLVAQLSLTFDRERQQPNHLSLDRPSGTWLMNSYNNPIHYAFEKYLCEIGNALISSIFNLQEFALLCGLLCFSTGWRFIGYFPA